LAKLIPILALAMLHCPCSPIIGVGKERSIYFDRLHGWYKTSPKMLDNVLHAGRYNDKDPQPITSAAGVHSEIHAIAAISTPNTRLKCYWA
jgi:hypothetical protein